MKEASSSRLSRYSQTTLLVGCSAGASSFIAGLITGERSRFMFPGIVVCVATFLLVAGVAAITLKQFPITVDPKKGYIQSIPRERVRILRWAMVICCLGAGMFFLVIAGMYYVGKDPLHIPNNNKPNKSQSPRTIAPPPDPPSGSNH